MWAQIAAAVAPTLLNQLLNSGRSGSSAISAAADPLRAARIPSMEELRYNPELYQYITDLNLERAGAPHLLGPSAYETISLDPSLRANQLTALAQARQRALSGFTAEDQAALQEYLQSAAAQAQSARKQVMEDMARRGTADSGAALVAALQGSQDAANMLNQQALRQAALKLQQQNAANEQLARLASNIEQADYGRATDLANRRDAIEQFNKQLLQKRDDTNLDLANKERMTNYARMTGVADKNVDIKNEGQLKNIDSRKWITSAELERAGGVSRAQQAAAQQYAEERANRASGIAGVTSGIMRSVFGIKDDKPTPFF